MQTKQRKSLIRDGEGQVASEKMRIYRVVDKEGYGYKTSLDSNIGSVMCMDYSNYYERRPLPENDQIDKSLLDENWFFGFECLEHYQSWFPLDERNAGTHFEGVLEIIEADPNYVIKGGRQVVFHADHAQTVARHPMNHFDTDEDRLKPFDVD
jgi:hypothetical protein